jgi:long-chain acyl-CoA synthetase
MPIILRKTITETFLARVKSSSDQIAFQYRDEGKWKRVTFREFYNEVKFASFGLINLGLKQGDRVALISQTRIDWSAIDMAILGARGVTVPVYPSSTEDETAKMLAHSEAKVVFVENAAQLEKILNIRAADPNRLPFLERVIVLEASAMRLAVNPQQNVRDVMTLDALRELGRREEGKNPTRFEENLMAAQPEDLFTLAYTTGTTGDAKGVPLTHENLMSVIEECLERMGDRIHPDNEVTLAFLPFSHVLGRLQSMIFYAIGGTFAFSQSPDRLPQDLIDIKPTLIFAVPRIFEKAYSQIMAAVVSENVVSRKLFDQAMSVGREYHEAFWNRKTPSIKIAGKYLLAKKMVFKHIVDRFGGKLRYAICGGAPLSKELGKFFEIAGIRILEGYGLTETCAPVTLNDPDHPRFGTVGKPLRDVLVKIAEDGEILLRSKKLFKGYYKNDDETREALRDGWFHTGDIGFLDQEGYLHITERKKDLIVTSTGKNIAPQKIETLAKTIKPIHEIVVYGDGKSFLTALVTLDRETLTEYANSHHILFSDYSSLVKNQKILTWVEKTLDQINARLPSYERIRKFIILSYDFTVEGGELTASLKIRRKVIYERYRKELESLYST